jgi:TatD DNase family protein
MEIKYFDIHSHLNLKPLLENMDEVITRMREEGVGTITVGTDLLTSKMAIEIAEKNEHLYATVGLHPTDTMDGEFDMDAYLGLAGHEKVVAIGETGLDYYRLPELKAESEKLKVKQKEIFLKQIEIAIKVGKPLMMHARPSKGSMDAYHDVLDILENYRLKTVDSRLLVANFHFFVGDIEVSKRALDQGHTMSFDGPITFSRDYDEVIRFLPIESIMAETDAPFALPEPYRSTEGFRATSGAKVCEPWMVKEVYKKIAEIKGMGEEEVRIQILENTESFFNFKI